MDCPMCGGGMVKARATNFGAEYDYCRACKKEYAEMVKLELPPLSATAANAFDKEMQDLLHTFGPLVGAGLTPNPNIPPPYIALPKALLPSVTYMLGTQSPCYSTLGLGTVHNFKDVKPKYGDRCTCKAYYWDTNRDRPISADP